MRNSNSSAILGIGKVNLKTGKCKYFNIFETWDGTVEVWKDYKGKHKLIFTAGENAIGTVGAQDNFHQDQTGRLLGRFTLITSCRVKDMATLIPQFGNKLSGFTYK